LNSLALSTTYVSTLTIELTYARKLESLTAFLTSHPEQAVYIRRLFLHRADSDTDVHAQLHILKQCHVNLASVSCSISVFHAYLACELASPNLYALSIDIGIDGSPGRLSSVPDTFSYDLMLFSNLSIIYFHSSTNLLRLELPVWPTVRTLAFSEHIFSCLSLSTEASAMKAKCAVLCRMQMSLLLRLTNVVRVCTTPEHVDEARGRCAEEPTPFEDAIKGILGHEMVFVPLDAIRAREERGFSPHDPII
jgi:hypothetical protein